jgi:hypothetical protein
MKQSWLQRRWPTVRAQGLLRFLLMRGMLRWGGLMSATVYVMLLIAQRRQGIQLDGVWPLVPLYCVPAGVLWALVSWHWNNYLYRKLGFGPSNTPE